jgi:hypothetical protein
MNKILYALTTFFVLVATASAIEPPRKPLLYGLGDQEPVCVDGTCYYPQSLPTVTTTTYGLVRQPRIIRRQVQPVVRSQVSYGLPVVVPSAPVESTEAKAEPVQQYAAPVIVSAPRYAPPEVFAPSVVSAPTPRTLYPTVEMYVESSGPCAICGQYHQDYQTVSYGNSGYVAETAIRQGIRERRTAFRRAWANRPGLFGWRVRRGLCQ